MMDFSNSPLVDQVGVEERVNRLNSRSLKKGSKQHFLRLALSMIDLTTLEGKDTSEKVRQLCQKAMYPSTEDPSLPPVAAICVYPTHVREARRLLEGSKVKVASVATGFPSGNTSLEVKLEDVKFAVSEGAHEIDMVISRGE